MSYDQIATFAVLLVALVLFMTEWVAIDLAALMVPVALGVLGVHRLYLGRPITALLMFFTGGGVVIWWWADIFAAATGTLNDHEGRPVTSWF